MILLLNNVNPGITVPEIYMPANDISCEKWAVVACDQYTSQPEYWNKVEGLVGESPSALRLTLPEIYLEKPDKDERISKINKTMEEYLETGILKSIGRALVYVDRKTSLAASRKGLIVALDLEEYEYSKSSQALTRATEGTVIERLPPRIRIRENAPVELPHIMVLIDDPARSVIEPLTEQTGSLEKLYDFDLMMDGGHIKGWKIGSPEMISCIFEAIGKLAEPDVFTQKYGVGTENGVLLFAVGDGNHSLASAKAYWDLLKKKLPESALESHPARYALVELVNVHDEGLQFEPIHRVLFDVDYNVLITDMLDYYHREGSKASFKLFESQEALMAALSERKDAAVHSLPFITPDNFGAVFVEKPGYNLEVGTLQCFLDEYLAANQEVKIDYIHGEEVVVNLGSKKGNMGFFLPPMDKHDLFKTVILDGALPRKTFSMGEAEEKRFYLECRKIR